ncbi:MAG: exosortase H [Planctomycetes bacterium RBG_13_60_9]|nr:MAG: exosortase H [Planctomycetes bacterium RBG_13_60_9]
MPPRGGSCHRHPGLRFLLSFGILAGVFYTIACFAPFYKERLFPLCLRLTAELSGAVLALLGQDIAIAGTLISTPEFSASIVRGCDAIEPTALFVCAVLAFPSSLSRKIPGVLVGALSLAILNFVRIVSLFLIGVYLPGILGIMHVDVWQGVFMLLAMMLWVLWLLWATHNPIPTERISD